MPPAAKTSAITIYYVGEVIPDCAEVIGGLTVAETLASPDCDWDAVLEKAKTEVRRAGGNGLEILQHYFPGQKGRNCHEIAAYILNIREDGEPVGLSKQAQEQFHDYVVSKEGDTTRCMITENYRDRIVYLYEYHGIMRVCKTPKNKLSAYHTETPIDTSKPQSKKKGEEYRVQIALNGGYTFRTARFSSDITGDYKDYLRKLSHGPDLGASLRINIEYGFNLGLHFDRFSKSHRAAAYAYDDDGNYFEGEISDRHAITFIGGSIGMLSSVTRNNKHFLCMDLLVGYLGYKDEAEEFGQNYKLTGRTVGYGVNFGYDYRITKHIAVGAEVSYIRGALSWVRYDDGAHVRDIDLGKTKEGLQRINLRAGVRFYL